VLRGTLNFSNNTHKKGVRLRGKAICIKVEKKIKEFLEDMGQIEAVIIGHLSNQGRRFAQKHNIHDFPAYVVVENRSGEEVFTAYGTPDKLLQKLWLLNGNL
jgi:hypothetical protein